MTPVPAGLQEVALPARLLGTQTAVVAMRGERTDPPHRTAYDLAKLLLTPWPRLRRRPVGRDTGGPRRSTPKRSPASTAAPPPRSAGRGRALGGCSRAPLQPRAGDWATLLEQAHVHGRERRPPWVPGDGAARAAHALADTPRGTSAWDVLGNTRQFPGRPAPSPRVIEPMRRARSSWTTGGTRFYRGPAGLRRPREGWAGAFGTDGGSPAGSGSTQRTRTGRYPAIAV